MGKNCLWEVVRYYPERFIRVYTSAKSDPLIDALLESHVPVQQQSSKGLTALVESESHQGFVAEVKGRNNLDLKDFLKKIEDKERALVLMLDSIFDPHNFGAILRASECFGVDALVYSKNRGVGITPVVTKSSVGASELVTIIQVSNLADTIRKFQEHNFWAVTAEIEGGKPLNEFTFPEKTLLILGSEGEGVRSLVSKLADEKVFIPMFGKIDSLNVSQAAAVLLSHFPSRN